MTNTKLLRQKIDESGLKVGFIAESLGISYHWLKKKIDGKVEFKAKEIQALCEVLSITDLQEKETLFFAQDVEKSSTKEQ
jgi:hypothetical protein